MLRPPRAYMALTMAFLILNEVSCRERAFLHSTSIFGSAAFQKRTKAMNLGSRPEQAQQTHHLLHHKREHCHVLNDDIKRDIQLHTLALFRPVTDSGPSSISALTSEAYNRVTLTAADVGRSAVHYLSHPLVHFAPHVKSPFTNTIVY
ncbi:hypothetical protein J6590_057789 [Homalodisca vitripennis]|nr:hypothetical protein J6590_057789 [Homalodisca vitripennis]